LFCIKERGESDLVHNKKDPACRVDLLPGNSSLFCSPQTLVNPLAPLTYMFADAVHPTTLTHLIIARSVLIEVWKAGMI